MNFLPKIPTDNLYKFMAITGLFLLSLVAAIYLYLGYLGYITEKERNEQYKYVRLNNEVHDIDKRLLAIDLGKCNQDTVYWLTEPDCSDNEIKFLNYRKEQNKIYINNFKKENQTNHSHFINIIEATNAIYFVYLLIIISIGSLWFGFRNWFLKIQKNNDEMQTLDLEIKRQTLQTLKNETKFTYSKRLKLQKEKYKR